MIQFNTFLILQTDISEFTKKILKLLELQFSGQSKVHITTPVRVSYFLTILHSFATVASSLGAYTGGAVRGAPPESEENVHCHSPQQQKKRQRGRRKKNNIVSGVMMAKENTPPPFLLSILVYPLFSLFLNTILNTQLIEQLFI